ncbi:MAG: Ni/Fe hydrogenase subunit alpha [Patescibacteria group bacterium]
MRIRIDHIAKIEGHASFTADIIRGDVKGAKVKIEEGARLFEGILRGRRDEEMPEIASRICGICPVVHNLTAYKALENAYGLQLDETAIILRKLMMLGQIINSHALHLFFFSLADFFGYKSDLQLINAYPESTHDAVKIRDIGNKLVEIVGGRSVHPITPCLGGFRKAPDINKLKELLNDFRNNLELTIRLAELFIKLKYPEFNRETSYVSLSNLDEYAIYPHTKEFGEGAYDGKIKIGKLNLKPEEYLLLVKEFQGADMVAKRTKFAGNTYMVGALARLHNNREQLNPEAKKLLEKSGLEFPLYNPFYNILAQAIEVVHCFEESIKLLELLTGEIKLTEPKIENRTGEGTGAIEAPRGTLFYSVKAKDGIIEDLNIITPTAQNLANLEADLEEFEHIEGFKNLKKEERADKIKMLIRAYDPCVTCSVH